MTNALKYTYSLTVEHSPCHIDGAHLRGTFRTPVGLERAKRRVLATAHTLATGYGNVGAGDMHMIITDATETNESYYIAARGYGGVHHVGFDYGLNLQYPGEPDWYNLPSPEVELGEAAEGTSARI